MTSNQGRHNPQRHFRRPRQRKFLVGKDWRCRVSILARSGHILNRPAGGAVSESFVWRFRSSIDEYGTGEHAFFCDLPPPVLGVRKEISQNWSFAGSVVALL